MGGKSGGAVRGPGIDVAVLIGTTYTRGCRVISLPIMLGERICITGAGPHVREALAEDLDVVEKSPNLLPYIANENLEPSASDGVNTFVYRVAAAMTRSIKGENYPQHGLDISISHSEPGQQAAPQQPLASDIRTPRSDAAPETVAAVKTETTAIEPERAVDRNRFTAFSIAAGLLVAVCVGMYIRAEQDLRQSLVQERDRVAALARELAMARRDLETEVAQASKATEEADRFRQTANAATAELEQERRRSAALARDLESAQRSTRPRR